MNTALVYMSLPNIMAKEYIFFKELVIQMASFQELLVLNWNHYRPTWWICNYGEYCILFIYYEIFFSVIINFLMILFLHCVLQ